MTHEQADFDALASVLAAHLLNEHAVPVLPRRLNRNVRAFLTLYGGELPFLEARDLSGVPVEMVTLVDTQSLTSVRGMNPKTRILVIDHHPRRENLPDEWNVLTSAVGATTTLLVEDLQERDSLLSVTQASLLLLGIYEDTGSLTYTRTTPRDLRAAAYLLDQGASLQIASSFLNHPLSLAQQSLYDRLRGNAEHLHIHGHTVVITHEDAGEMDEELSSIAHKIRDLLEPDALFMVVTTRNGVQLIARSTSDHIDVSEVLNRFGGGGHDRAAAALVRDRTLDDVRQELISILPEFVQPAVTVAEIMSLGAQILQGDTPVEEAARRMRRYGYEGYPVVETRGSPPQARVIGLLTRRAVDRAIAHKLNLTAANLMDAGEVTIRPDDSLEELQRVMTDSGWGQVPVVDPQSGALLGIVTRTDLLKTLRPKGFLPGEQNLGGRLESTLPAERLGLLQAIARAAFEQHAALYIVGGFVRDLILEHPSLDFDLVVEGDAIALATLLVGRHGGRVTSHTRFGTAKWHLAGSTFSSLMQGPEPLDALDLVSARTEFYTHPSALPTVERGSIKLDLHRRDFTINTLALRLDGRHYGELHDYWGGLNDLRQGIVRVLHSLSFVDDPTRILRAVRFEQRFSFRIESRTLELLQQAIPLLDRLSGERVRHELNHIFHEPRKAFILARLDELALLRAIHPALQWDSWFGERIQSLTTTPPGSEWELDDSRRGLNLTQDLCYALWLLRQTPAQAAQVCERLRLPMELSEAILQASSLWFDLPGLTTASPSQVVLRLETLSPLARYAAWLGANGSALGVPLEMYAHHWRSLAPAVNGDDLRRLGLRPGPAFRTILWELRRAWLDGEIHTQGEEQQLLSNLIHQEGLN